MKSFVSFFCFLAAAGFSLSAPQFAAADGIELVAFDDAKTEARYFALVKTMRCLVCQNQTLAESNAPLAEDMRAVVRDMLRDGKTEKEITEFMQARYGDFVLYEPPLARRTILLWAGPFIFLAAVLFLLPRFVARRRVKLSAAQRAAAQNLLRDPPRDKSDE